jgi:hypothetical protein
MFTRLLSMFSTVQTFFMKVGVKAGQGGRGLRYTSFSGRALASLT